MFDVDIITPLYDVDALVDRSWRPGRFGRERQATSYPRTTITDNSRFDELRAYHHRHGGTGNPPDGDYSSIHQALTDVVNTPTDITLIVAHRRLLTLPQFAPGLADAFYRHSLTRQHQHTLQIITAQHPFPVTGPDGVTLGRWDTRFRQSRGWALGRHKLGLAGGTVTVDEYVTSKQHRTQFEQNPDIVARYQRAPHYSNYTSIELADAFSRELRDALTAWLTDIRKIADRVNGRWVATLLGAPYGNGTAQNLSRYWYSLSGNRNRLHIVPAGIVPRIVTSGPDAAPPDMWAYLPTDAHLNPDFISTLQRLYNDLHPDTRAFTTHPQPSSVRLDDLVGTAAALTL
jgi:hypothetical protein